MGADLYIEKTGKYFRDSYKSKEERREQPRVLAETLEAVIGAIYHDAGYEEASRIVRLLFDV